MSYILVVRDEQGERLAALGVERSLTKLRGLLFSFFRQYERASSIDVLPWPLEENQTLDTQEPLVGATRSSEQLGAIVWVRERELRAIEADLKKGKA